MKIRFAVLFLLLSGIFSGGLFLVRETITSEAGISVKNAAEQEKIPTVSSQVASPQDFNDGNPLEENLPAKKADSAVWESQIKTPGLISQLVFR